MFNTKNKKLGGYEVGSREHRILNFEVPKMWDRIWGTSAGRRKNSNIFLNSFYSEFFRYGGGISEFGSILELWIMTHFCKNDMSHSICIRIYALYISFDYKFYFEFITKKILKIHPRIFEKFKNYVIPELKTIKTYLKPI